MRRNYCIILLLINVLLCFSQQDSTQVKTNDNPILYGGFTFGGSGGKVDGLTFGANLNYQINKDLITFRSIYIIDKNNDVGLAAIFIIPLFFGGDSMNENALLYGKRFIFEGSALSISAGISSNLRKYKVNVNNESIQKRSSYIGIPFEVNFDLFKNRKKRYRIIYGLIPIGKPTAFGRYFGIKFFGNFGKFNYFGLGMNFGLGWHKKH